MSDEILLSTFERLQKRLLRMAGKLLHNDEDAQDILQDAFCRLWSNYRNIDSPSEIEALSITTVKNLSISSIRKQQETTPIEEWQSKTDEESTSLYKEKQFRVVEQLINQHLSALQRTILNKRELEGKSTQQIANELGMKETAVRMNLSRARKTIKDLYNKQKS